MSLRVKSLNADSSFLLIFSPPAATYDPQGTFPGSFTILVDPWLLGASTVVHRKFASTTHTVPCCVESLDALPDPDLVIISQDQSDHCHRETLLTLPSDTNAQILTTSAAARKILSWKHFNPSNVVALPRYDHRSPAKSVISIPIPAYSSSGQAGEVTVALLEPKRDLTGLHNAIGITYRPPSSSISARNVSFFNLSPPSSPPLDSTFGTRVMHSYLPASGLGSQSFGLQGTMTPPTTPPSISTASTTSSSGLGPLSSQISAPITSGDDSLHREKTLSIIYSPHGLPYNYIKPYVMTHLLAHSALPLTVLFHSLDRIENPWYLGGRVIEGGHGGAEIAGALNPQVWISAHDEEKESTGWSVTRMKQTRMDIKSAEELLRNDAIALKKKRPFETRVVELDSGEEFLLQA